MFNSILSKRKKNLKDKSLERDKRAMFELRWGAIYKKNMNKNLFLLQVMHNILPGR
jgi:hypothetical protein